MKRRFLLFVICSFVILLALMVFLVPTSASADSMMEETLTISYAGASSLVGGANLYTGTATNLVLTDSPQFSVPVGAINNLVFSKSGLVSTAACWIAIDGSMTVNSTTIPVFGFASGTSVNNLPQPTSAPLVNTGMTDGTFTFTYTGELIAFDSPMIIGSWTLTETPALPDSGSTIGLLFLSLVTLFGARRSLFSSFRLTRTNQSDS